MPSIDGNDMFMLHVHASGIEMSQTPTAARRTARICTRG
jgi:hypothetical protein